MRFLRQSTSVDVPVGPFLDATDGATAETALTITQPDIRLKKNGGAWAQKNAAQTLSHEENGFYEVTLDTTDTNTLGLMRLAVFESGALPVWEDFCVIAQAMYDALFGSGNLPANVLAIASNADAPAILDRGVRGTVRGTVGGGSGTTSVVTSSLTPAASVTDQFKGRILTFDKDTTTAALRGQATNVTASSSGGVLTVSALTTAPASGDTFTLT